MTDSTDECVPYLASKRLNVAENQFADIQSVEFNNFDTWWDDAGHINLADDIEINDTYIDHMRHSHSTPTKIKATGCG